MSQQDFLRFALAQSFKAASPSIQWRRSHSESSLQELGRWIGALCLVAERSFPELGQAAWQGGAWAAQELAVSDAGLRATHGSADGRKLGAAGSRIVAGAAAAGLISQSGREALRMGLSAAWPIEGGLGPWGEGASMWARERQPLALMAELVGEVGGDWGWSRERVAELRFGMLGALEPAFCLIEAGWIAGSGRGGAGAAQARRL